MKKFYFFSASFFGLLTIIYEAAPVYEAAPSCLEKEKSLALLETAENLLTKAGVSFPSCREDANSTDEAGCGKKKSLAYIEISKKMISDVRKSFPTCSKLVKKDDKIVEDVKYRDCSEILANGRNKSGVYTISNGEFFSTGNSLQVYCDMETDKGGWTVIQRRGKFPVQQDFQKDWETYKNGFGNVSEEFWLGNENIRVLCLKGCEIRFDLEDENGAKGFALYRNFNLSLSNYRLSISGYTGNVDDEMQHGNNYDFSTKDKGNVRKVNIYKGGWWYGVDLYFCNLNGIYQPGKSNADTVFWDGWRKRANLASVEMKVRPK